MADLFRRGLDKVGKGGVHCKCCNKFTGKHKKKLRKLVRKRVLNDLQKELKEMNYEN